MPFGRDVTSFLADLIPTDPLAPQVASDFVQIVPPNPVEGVTKGETVSPFVQELYPGGAFAPSDPYGPQLSEFIQLLHTPDLGDSGLFFV